MENTEIERKFLIPPECLPEDLGRFPHTDICQLYLCFKPTLRLRRAGNEYILTYKEGGGMAHIEREIAVSKDAFIKLSGKAEGRPVEKTRYRIPRPEGGHDIELDVFSGRHSGLLMAEVEFASVEEALAFAPPAWFGTEVTDDPRYKNTWLAKH